MNAQKAMTLGSGSLTNNVDQCTCLPLHPHLSSSTEAPRETTRMKEKNIENKKKKKEARAFEILWKLGKQIMERQLVKGNTKLCSQMERG